MSVGKSVAEKERPRIAPRPASETGRRVLHGTPLSAVNGSESVRSIVNGSAALGPPALCPLITLRRRRRRRQDLRTYQEAAVIFVVFLR